MWSFLLEHIYLHGTYPNTNLSISATNDIPGKQIFHNISAMLELWYYGRYGNANKDNLH